MTDRWRRASAISARVVLGALLLGAGALKAGAGEAAAESLANYRLLPAQANQILAVLMPWWEISLGIMLISGLWLRACASLAALLLGGFALAVVSALARGLDISCGCFGTELELRAGLPHVVATLSLTLLAGWIARRSGAPVESPDPRGSGDPADRRALP